MHDCEKEVGIAEWIVCWKERCRSISTEENMLHIFAFAVVSKVAEYVAQKDSEDNVMRDDRQRNPLQTNHKSSGFFLAPHK